MAVEDISSSENQRMMSRLELAKKLIQDGVNKIPGDHALITYARDASVEIPFTQKKDHFSTIVSQLNPVEFYGGSNLMSAISLANTLYSKSDGPIEIILISDGGIEEGGNIIYPLSLFHISILGIGTTRGGKIPLGYDADGEKRYKYFNGQEVVVGFDDAILKKLSTLYNASSIKIEKDSPFPPELISPPLSQEKGIIFLFFGTFAILIGYLFHPYVRRK